MRVTLLVSVLLLSAAACRTQPYDQPFGQPTFDLAGSDGAGFDLGPSPIDLSHPPIDMTRRPDLARFGCAALAMCVVNCGDPMCFQQCESRASTMAITEFGMAVSCGQQYCLGQNGAMARCAIDSTSMLVDAPGVPMGDCNVCLQNIFEPLFGGGCSPPNDPACTTPICQMAMTQCRQN